MVDFYSTFQNLSLLGKGSYGSVYRASLRGVQGCVKKLSSNHIDCRNEGTVLQASQGHPNVCKLLSLHWCSETHAPVLFLELLAPLPSVMDPCNLHDVSRDILSALTYLWRLTIVHNDIKPDNILVRHTREYVLSDFGSALTVGPGPLPEGDGSAEYLPPDRFQCQTGSDLHKVDVYSLGLSLFVLWSGIRPVEISNAFCTKSVRGFAMTYLAEKSGTLAVLVKHALELLPNRPTAYELLQ